MPKDLKLIRNSLIVVSFIQTAYIVTSAWHYYMNKHNISYYLGLEIPIVKNPELFFLLGSSSLGIIMIFLGLEILKTTNLEMELAREKISIELAENAIQLLRGHRHDFLNHLQVIMGYISLNRASAAKDYISNINNQLTEMRLVSNIKLPEIAVLLLSKKQEAARNNIKLNYTIKTDLENLKINPVDLVRVLSNLIDNAFYELRKNPHTEERRVEVSFDYIGSTLFIEVTNTGSYIADKNKIFEYGYTTKGEQGTGIGLYNVKSLVEKKYGGRIDVQSDYSTGTSFKIAI